MPASPSSPPPDYITTRQAAALHDVSPATIRSWVRRGLLTPIARVRDTNVYRTRDVDEAEHQARKRDLSKRAQSRLA